MGSTFQHKDKLLILFGDTWAQADSICRSSVLPTNDDTLGTLPLAYAGAPDAPACAVGTSSGTNLIFVLSSR